MSFSKAPWNISNVAMEDFVKVTDINRQHVVRTIGRILYVVEPVGRNNMYKGAFSIDPQLLKGWWHWPFMPFAIKPKEFSNNTHFKVFIQQGQKREEWIESYKPLLDKFILAGELYFKPADPILTYIKE